MRCIQSCTAAARARDSRRLFSGSPVASVCPEITISQPGWALISTSALIRILAESALSWALPLANSDRLSNRTGLAARAGDAAGGGST